MSVDFEYLGRQWRAVGSGMGHGVAAGHVPEATHWGVLFTDLGANSPEPLYATIRVSSPAEATAEQLVRALQVAVVSSFLESADEGKGVAEIAVATGIPEDDVVRTLTNHPERFRRAVFDSPEGDALYHRS